MPRRKIKVGLVQINASFSGQSYFPYSVGVLQAYAQSRLSRPSDFEFLLPIYSRLPVEEAVRELLEADVVGFSLYVWNAHLSLRIAQALKRSRPKTLIVFGGPHVPDRAERFLRENPFVDVACHGEGEQAFLAVLEGARSGDLSRAPGTSRLEGGRLAQTPRAERIRDLSTVPSPYLEGSFDALMLANPDQKWIALWETNRGCPFSCTFCDWGSAVAAKVNAWPVERLHAELEWFAGRRVEFLFLADANFGILPRDIELARYLAELKRRSGYPQAISVQSTKNATDRSYQVQKILSDAGLNKGVVLSLQSLDGGTLKAIKRQNISLKVYHELQRRFAADRVETVTDLILGLPGETYASFARGVAAVIDNGQHNRIQFNNLSILPNAEMGDPEYQRRHGMVIVETKVVNVHGELSATEVEETQELVVGTAAMPKPDWVRARAFCWTAGLLYFNKILQIPLVLARQAGGVGFAELFELFGEDLLGRSSAAPDFPVLAEIAAFFRDKALDIQAGGKEFCHRREWLDIWWPADEFVFIKLCVEGKRDAFYREAEALLARALPRAAALPPRALHEAVQLNSALLKQPFQSGEASVALTYNVWDFYSAFLLGRPIELKESPSVRVVDQGAQTWGSWDEWFQQVVWYGNKKGAYLYSPLPTDPRAELAGHY